MNLIIEEAQPHRSIQLDDVTRLLVRQNILSANTAKQVSTTINPDDPRHPFVQLGDLDLRDLSNPNLDLTLSTETITRLIAEATNIAYVRIDPLKIDVEAVTSLVSQAYATRFQFLPVEVTGTYVTIATAEPYVREWESELMPILKREVRHVLANPLDIEKYLKEFYGVSRSLFGAATKAADEQGVSIGNFEQLTELGAIGELDANDQHVVHLVDWLLQYAFDQRASDIHIEPRRTRGNIRFRIDGVLHLVHQFEPPILAATTSRLKSLGRMDVADKRRPQDGRCNIRRHPTHGYRSAELPDKRDATGCGSTMPHTDTVCSVQGPGGTSVSGMDVTAWI